MLARTASCGACVATRTRRPHSPRNSPTSSYASRTIAPDLSLGLGERNGRLRVGWRLSLSMIGSRSAWSAALALALLALPIGGFLLLRPDQALESATPEASPPPRTATPS